MVVYKVTNLLNGKVYVGYKLNDRKSYLGSGPLIKQAIAKYGRENFQKEILEVCTSIEEVKEQEIFWIKKLNCIAPNGYNITEGGLGATGLKHSPETIEKIKIARNRNPEERNAKISASKKGVPNPKHSEWMKANFSGSLNPFFGKKQTDETKRKISDAKKGRSVHSEEWKINHSERIKILWQEHPEWREREIPKNFNSTGRNHTPETKEKISASSKGRKRSEEFKKNQSERMKARWRENPNMNDHHIGKKRSPKESEDINGQQ
jgi:group I intron endonuclease